MGAVRRFATMMEESSLQLLNDDDSSSGSGVEQQPDASLEVGTDSLRIYTNGRVAGTSRPRVILKALGNGAKGILGLRGAMPEEERVRL